MSAAKPDLVGGTWAAANARSDGYFLRHTTAISGRTRLWYGKRPITSNTRSVPIVVGGGDDASDDDNIEFESPVVRAAQTPQIADRPDASWSRGAVLQVGDESVLCEILTRSGSWEVDLPRVFFSGEVRYGMPFRLGMRMKNGFRTPVVERVEDDIADGADIRRLTDLQNALDAL